MSQQFNNLTLSKQQQQVVNPNLHQCCGQEIVTGQQHVCGSSGSSSSFTQQQQVIDIQERRVIESQHFVSQQPQTIIDTSKYLASEIPITSERITTTEFVPVSHEKLIQRIPVVVEQRVETGGPMGTQTNIQSLGAQYAQQETKTQVGLQPHMRTETGGQSQLIEAEVTTQTKQSANLNQNLIENLQASGSRTQQQVIDIQEKRVIDNPHNVSQQPQSIVDTSRYLASEIPVTSERITSTEFVPVSREKVIQRIPVVVEQKVQTGGPIGTQTNVEAVGTQYVQQEVKTQVGLQPHMHTEIGGQSQLLEAEVTTQTKQFSNLTLPAQQQTVNQNLIENQQAQTSKTITKEKKWL